MDYNVYVQLLGHVEKSVLILDDVLFRSTLSVTEYQHRTTVCLNISMVSKDYHYPPYLVWVVSNFTKLSYLVTL